MDWEGNSRKKAVPMLVLSTGKGENRAPEVMQLGDDDMDGMKARTPLATAVKTTQDFSRVLRERKGNGDGEATDLEGDEEGVVGPMLSALNSDIQPPTSPGKRFSHPISPLSKSSRRTPTSSSRKPDSDRSLVLQELAKSIYSTFSQDRTNLTFQKHTENRSVSPLLIPSKQISTQEKPKNTPIFTEKTQNKETNTEFSDIKSMENTIFQLKEELKNAEIELKNAENSIKMIKNEKNAIEEKLAKSEKLVENLIEEKRKNTENESKSSEFLYILQKKLEEKSQENQALKLQIATFEKAEKLRLKKSSKCTLVAQFGLYIPPLKPVFDLETTSTSLHQLLCPQPIQPPEPYYLPSQNNLESQRILLEQEREKLVKQLANIPKNSRSLANKRRKLAIECELQVIIANLHDLDIL